MRNGSPLWYGVVFSLGSALVSFLVWRQLNPEITEAVLRSRQRLAKEHASIDARILSLYNQGITVLEEYFLKRPHLRRYLVSGVGGLVGLGLAAAWMSTGDGRWRTAAYLLFVTLLVVSGAVIIRWRLERDKALRILNSQLQGIADGNESH